MRNVFFCALSAIFFCSCSFGQSLNIDVGISARSMYQITISGYGALDRYGVVVSYVGSDGKIGHFGCHRLSGSPQAYYGTLSVPVIQQLSALTPSTRLNVRIDAQQQTRLARMITPELLAPVDTRRTIGFNEEKCIGVLQDVAFELGMEAPPVQLAGRLMLPRLYVNQLTAWLQTSRRIEYSADTFYDGTSTRLNELQGSGRFHYSGGYVYDGAFRSGNRQGRGQLTGRDGSTLSGDFDRDSISGDVAVVFANGDRYRGSLSNSEIGGTGTYWFHDGKRYAGSFKNGSIDGQGTLILRNGRQYRAAFVNGFARGIPVAAVDMTIQRISAHFGDILTKDTSQVPLKR